MGCRSVAGILKLVRSIVSVLARRFCSRAVLELEKPALRHQLHLGGLARRRLPDARPKPAPKGRNLFRPLEGLPVSFSLAPGLGPERKRAEPLRARSLISGRGQTIS